MSAQPGLDRRAFVAALMALLPGPLVISGLGSPTYDLHAAGDRDTNFYLWGAMGAAVPMGLGLALAQPDRDVVVLTGDGEILMGIGSLATAAACAPANLGIVVLDNGRYGETGMQPSHTSLGTDLLTVAEGFGIKQTALVTDTGQVPELAARLTARTGPLLARVLIEGSQPPRSLPRRDGVAAKLAFRAALGLDTF